MALAWRAGELADLLHDRGQRDLALVADNLDAGILEVVHGVHGRLP